MFNKPYHLLILGLFVLCMAALGIFVVEYVEKNEPKPGRASAPPEYDAVEAYEASKQKAITEREKENQEYQATFVGKKFAVVSVKEELDSAWISTEVSFETMDEGYFTVFFDKISVVLDRNLSGTYLSVKQVGRAFSMEKILALQNYRHAGEVVLYVNTVADKRQWDNYLLEIKRDIERSQAPRRVAPPTKARLRTY